MNATHLEAAPAIPASHLSEKVAIPINGISLPAELVVPAGACGLVLFTLAGGCIRETSRAGLMAQAIEAGGVATLTFSLLTRAESKKDHHTGYWSFDLDLLTHRFLQATSWAMRQPETRDLGIGYMGTSTFAAAALVAAARLGYIVQGVVSRAGRPDFAGESLPKVMAPTLLIVGERDEALLDINRRAMERLFCRKELSIVPEADHLFEEAGALEQVGALAADWFRTHLKSIKRN